MMSVVSARSGIAARSSSTSAQVALAAVRAPHRLQHARRSGLERQVRVLADGVALRHRGDHVAAEVLRVRAREPDALDALDRVARRAGARRSRLPRSRPYELTFWPSSVTSRTPSLARRVTSARISPGRRLTSRPRTDGHDAVRADRVAAHRDLHPGLEAALAVHRQRAGELALLTDAEAAARSGLAPGAEPIREMRDRARPERDVDERVEVEEPLALGLRVTAADGDHLLRVGELEHLRVAEVRGEALVRLLADRAGVEDDARPRPPGRRPPPVRAPRACP